MATIDVPQPALYGFGKRPGPGLVIVLNQTLLGRERRLSLLLAEDDSRGFRLTEAGALLREDHPNSLTAMALLEEGPERPSRNAGTRCFQTA